MNLKKIKLFYSFYKLFFYLLDNIVLDNFSQHMDPELEILENDLLTETEGNSNHVGDMIQMKPGTTLLRCAAHSLQSCVEHTLKTDAVRLIVTKAREVLFIYTFNL